MQFNLKNPQSNTITNPLNDLPGKLETSICEWMRLILIPFNKSCKGTLDNDKCIPLLPREPTGLTLVFASCLLIWKKTVSF